MYESIKYFRTVLNRLILPKFPSLTGFDILTGTVTDETLLSPVFRVQVDFTIKDGIKNKEQREIELETKSLFKMIGFPDDVQLRIFFSKEIR